MASKATITLMLLGKLCHRSLAAPAGDGVESLGSTGSLTTGSQQPISLFRSSLEQPQSATTRMYDVETLLLSPLYKPSSTTTAPPEGGTRAPSSFSYSQSHPLTPSTTSSAPYAKTVTVTEEVPTTITVSANPVTVTEILVPPPAMTTSASPSRAPTGLGPAKSIWLSPTDLSDLSTFHVSKFTGGQGNLEFVDSVPAEAKGPEEVVSSNDSGPPSTTLLQLHFPAGSIDPGKKPQGGAEFYASPIDITSAQNVTLQYSVFFPLGFDFVLGGKLPGLYGGHTGCSGGDPAVDCFSTRLMWREGGAGELYLYAPKNKQSNKLCKAEGSVCDAMYGFSIGRGFFFWKPGEWTTIKQTVFLNTPGKQDGIFTLDVDGKRVISRNDLLYRDDLREAGKGSGKGKVVKQKTTTKHTKTKPTTVTTTATEATTSSSDDGDLLGLGHLLSSLLGGLRREVDPEERSEERIKSAIATTVAAAMDAGSSSSSTFPEIIPRAPLPTRTHIPESSSQDLLSGMGFEIESTKEDVKFVGIFFSTFFGGHDNKYATPRGQYVWFKNFGLAFNS